jgi:predicted XRE-type DNA-binding protein
LQGCSEASGHYRVVYLASLVHEIRAKVKAAGWTQTETAEQLGISQPRVSDLLNGKLSKFSLDALVNMLALLGGDIESTGYPYSR